MRQTDAPECFKDFNVDQIFAPILKAKEEFELGEFFYTALHDPEIVVYRQDVMRDLENDEVRASFTGFSKTVHDLGGYMENTKKAFASDSIHEKNYLIRGRMLDYADHYCNEVSALASGLSNRS